MKLWDEVLFEKLKSRTKPNAAACWEWQRHVDRNGYARVSVDGKNKTAHRQMWFAVNGTLATTKLYICHACDNKKCINPAHLFIGTAKDNSMDMCRKGRAKAQLYPELQTGELHPSARLKNRDILKIRSLAGQKTQKQIAAEFGLCQSYVSQIILRKRWRHL